MTQPQPGWYPDPADPARQRYWAGDAWTAETRALAPDSPAVAPMPAHTDPYARYAQGATNTAPYAPQPDQAMPAYPPAASQTHYTQQFAGHGPTTADGVPLSGWWWRVLASVIDSLVLGVLAAIYMPFIPNLRSGLSDWTNDLFDWAFQGSADPNTMPLLSDPSYHLATAFTTYTVVSLVVTCVYVIVMLSLTGATLGMLACGLRVVPVDKGLAPRRLPLAPVLLRLVFYTLIPQALSLIGLISMLHATSWTSMSATSPFSAIGSVYMLINVLWAAWDKKRQCLHDKAARTQVIRPVR